MMANNKNSVEAHDTRGGLGERDTEPAAVGV